MCNFIYNIIHYLFIRAMMVMLFLAAPLFFLMAGGGCAKAKKETIELYKGIWEELNVKS